MGNGGLEMLPSSDPLCSVSDDDSCHRLGGLLLRVCLVEELAPDETGFCELPESRTSDDEEVCRGCN